jgi:hypothetical protein
MVRSMHRYRFGIVVDRHVDIAPRRGFDACRCTATAGEIVHYDADGIVTLDLRRVLDQSEHGLLVIAAIRAAGSQAGTLVCCHFSASET